LSPANEFLISHAPEPGGRGFGGVYFFDTLSKIAEFDHETVLASVSLLLLSAELKNVAFLIEYTVRQNSRFMF